MQAPPATPAPGTTTENDVLTDFTRFGVFLTASMALAEPALAKPPLSASDWLPGSGSRTISRPGGPTARAPRTGSAAPSARSPLARSSRSASPGWARAIPTPAARFRRTAGLPSNLWGPAIRRRWHGWSGASNPRCRRCGGWNGGCWRPVAAAIDRGQGRGQLFCPRRQAAGHGRDRRCQGIAASRRPPAIPKRFRRLFDIALLSRDETPCLRDHGPHPGVAPSFPARIFCLALGGDWAAAALVFHGAEVMDKWTRRWRRCWRIT